MRSQVRRTPPARPPRDGPNEPSQPTTTSASSRTSRPSGSRKVRYGRSVSTSCTAVSLDLVDDLLAGRRRAAATEVLRVTSVWPYTQTLRPTRSTKSRWWRSSGHCR